MRTYVVRFEYLFKKATFLRFEFYYLVIIFKFELNCIEFWRELGRRSADTLGFALGRSRGITISPAVGSRFVSKDNNSMNNNVYWTCFSSSNNKQHEERLLDLSFKL